jgi:hypothetical protein
LSVDFQVVFPQQVVPLNSVRILTGVTPRSIDVIGTDFRAVDQVLINDLASPDVVILSKNRLLAQVPDAMLQSTLTSVTVVSNSLTLSAKSASCRSS